MSTLKVSEIRNAATTAGGISIDSSGAVSGGLPTPNRNLLYNGAMQVAQRGTSATGLGNGDSGYYTADRWRFGEGGAPTVEFTQTLESDGPSGSGFSKSLKMLVTTADASLAANDFMVVSQTLEGQDVQRLKKGTSSAESVVLSFWVKSNVTGTYIVGISDFNNGRYIAGSYTVLSSGVWERKTIVFSGDTTGAFNNDNGGSLFLHFALAMGSDYTSGSLATNWESTVSANRFVGQTNLAAATNNYWQITGVQLEVGDTATEFEHLPYGVELARCQRYYYLHASGNTKPFAMAGYESATVISGIVHFPVEMRTAPSLVATSGTGYYTEVFYSDLFNSLTIFAPSTSVTQIYNNSEIAGTKGTSGLMRTNSASASVAFSAEL